jgi:hypothetical protein
MPEYLIIFSRERSSTGSNDCFVVVVVVVVVPVAHFVPSRVTWYSVSSCQELQVKNCKKKSL